MRWWRTITFPKPKKPGRMTYATRGKLVASMFIHSQSHIHNGLPHLIYMPSQFLATLWLTAEWLSITLYSVYSVIRWHSLTKCVINPNKSSWYKFLTTLRCTNDSVAPHEPIDVIPFFFFFLFFLCILVSNSKHHSHVYGIWNDKIKRTSNTNSFALPFSTQTTTFLFISGFSEIHF